MQIDRSDIDRIRQRVDLGEVVRDTLGVPLRRVGDRLMLRCPFHQEKTASFSVNLTRQFYYCFGCHETGDVFTFLMKVQGTSFVEAVEELAQRAGVRLEGRSMAPAARARLEAQKSLYEVVERVARLYHRWLFERPEAAPARAYLERRGLRRPTIDEFLLGYAPPRYDLTREPELRDISPETLERASLLRRDASGRSRPFFRGRLMIPLRDNRRRFVSFGARALEADQTPKYLNTAETEIYSKSRLLYGLDLDLRELRTEGRALLVEGYFDVILPYQEGLRGVVAPCGTALTESHALLVRRHVDRVVLLFDGDAAGVRAAERAARLLFAKGLEVYWAPLPEGLDPADLCQAGRVDELRRRIDRAPPVFEALLERALASSDVTSARGKAELIDRFLPLLRAMSDEIMQLHYYPRLAQAVGVQPEVVRRRLASDRRWSGADRRSRPPARSTDQSFSRGPSRRVPAGRRGGLLPRPSTPPVPPLSPRATLETELLGALLRCPDLRADVLAEYPPETFETEGLRAAAASIALSDPVSLVPDVLNTLDELGETHLRRRLAAAATAPTDREADENVLLGCLRKLEIELLRQRLSRLNVALAGLSDGPADRSEVRRLQEEKAALRARLTSLRRL